MDPRPVSSCEAAVPLRRFRPENPCLDAGLRLEQFRAGFIRLKGRVAPVVFAFLYSIGEFRRHLKIEKKGPPKSGLKPW